MATSNEVKLAKLEARTADRRALADAASAVLNNPIAVGVAALALNYAAFRAGAYKGVPARSILGGPVWLTIGSPASPDVEQYTRYELFIMTATAALAISGGVKGLAGGFSSMSNLIKGVAS